MFWRNSFFLSALTVNRILIVSIVINKICLINVIVIVIFHFIFESFYLTDHITLLQHPPTTGNWQGGLSPTHMGSKVMGLSLTIRPNQTLQAPYENSHSTNQKADDSQVFVRIFSRLVASPASSIDKNRYRKTVR